MDLKPDDEIQEMMEEFSEDLGRDLNKEDMVYAQRSSLYSLFQENPIIWCAIAIAILLSLFSLFFNNSGESLTKDLDSIKTRLEQIEKRTALFEERFAEQGPLLTQIKDVKQSISQLSGSDKSLDAGLRKLNTNLAALTKELESVKKTSQIGKGESIPPASTNLLRQHTVQKGDTLYKLSQKYSVPIDELRKLNKLKNDQDIFPGQKLKIPATGS